MLEDIHLLEEAERNGVWFGEHSSRLEDEMPGKLIAIRNQKILASADTVEELLEKLQGTDLRTVLVVAISSEESASIL